MRLSPLREHDITIPFKNTNNRNLKMFVSSVLYDRSAIVTTTELCCSSLVPFQ